MNNTSFTFIRQVQASPEQVYYAMTNGTALREWFADVASTRPSLGGRFYCAWNSGFYAAGEFSELEPDKLVAFTWFGRGEPAATSVRVTLAEQAGGTMVTLEHSGVGSGPEWENTRTEIEKGWNSSLENLASVLESGQDLRFVLRPMLGITISDFNAEIAAHLGVPVTQGLRLDGVVPGMGAEQASLQAGDVLVSMAGATLTDFPSLSAVLQGKRAGEVVEVVFYRGSEKKVVQMALSRRPIPEIPATSAEISTQLEKRYRETTAELEQLFAGVSQDQARRKPASDEWSAMEILAHLIHGELGWHNYIADILNGQEPLYDDFGSNLHARTAATVEAYDTLEAMLTGLKRAWAETVALFAHLPPEFAQRKGSYWRVAYAALEEPLHFHTHMEQMRAALVR
jgi:uncharacterized protein YndB with AHSA1/START domain